MSLARRIINALESGADVGEVDRMLKPDYIPKGERIKWDDCVNWRRCDDQLVRCTAQTSYDSQSGPIYCGQPANFMADVKGNPGAIVPCCNRHTPHKIHREVQKTENDYQHGAFI